MDTRRIYRFRALVAVALVLAVSICAGAKPALGQGGGQVVVKMKKWGSINRAVSGFDGTVRDSIDKKCTYLVDFADEYTLEDVVDILDDDESVVYSHGNTVMALPETHQLSQGFPDENRPSFIWGLTPAAYYEQPIHYDTGIDSAQTLASGHGVVMAIIDNGIVFEHPLIREAFIRSPHDFVENGKDPSEHPGPLYGHGTFVAGLVLLTAPDVTIMPLRAFDENGQGNQFAVAKAIHWAVTHKASVINMSFGTDEPSAMMADAVHEAERAGLVMVAAAGNRGSDAPEYPAAYHGVVAVSSFDTLEVLAGFSNWGDHIDLCAPGVNLYSALPGEAEWGTWSGTSFSAPLVSGTVALMRELAPRTHTPELVGVLKHAARADLLWGTVDSPDEQYGYGALDAFEAVKNTPAASDGHHPGRHGMKDVCKLVKYIRGQSHGTDIPDLVFEAHADLNCDGVVDQSDIDVLVEYLYEGGKKPKPCDKKSNKKD